jgi:glutamine amidotransferase
MARTIIVDYGMGNLRSVQKAFEKAGSAAEISADPGRVAEADKLVLPGVGAFGDAVARLRESGLDRPIAEHVRGGRPFLGICLGLQLLFEKSWEDGEHQGLSLFPGEVVGFPAGQGVKVPHMGWNQLRVRRRSPLLQGIAEGAEVYFVHSYFVVPADRGLVSTETDYPTPFASSIWHGNVVATQFHPEKSQAVGLAMIRNFAAMR